MRETINPFLSLNLHLSKVVSSLYSIWQKDRDDLVEDATKIIGLIAMNMVINAFPPISMSSRILIYSASYISLNEAGDYLGDYIDGDDSNDKLFNTNSSGAASYVGKIAADVTEDSFKTLFIIKHWVIGTGLEVVNKNIPYHWSIVAKTASYLYTCIDLLGDYSEWNQFSDKIGNWVEDQLMTNSFDSTKLVGEL